MQNAENQQASLTSIIPATTGAELKGADAGEILRERVRSNAKFEFKISTKKKFNAHCADAIREFLADQDVKLPPLQSDYRRSKDAVLKYTEHGAELESAFGNLINLYYTLRETGRSVGAVYMNRDGALSTQTLFHTYSRHKLDNVWNMRKEQIIRSTYFKWITEQLSSGVLQNYMPVHVMLSVPHPGGLFNGKRFYGDDILYFFNLMRKRAFWQASVWGGEYGLETKAGAIAANGLHIHLHSLTFLNKHYNLNALRKASAAELAEIALDKLGHLPHYKGYTLKHFKWLGRFYLESEVVNYYKSRRVSIADFRADLQKAWVQYTGGRHIWVEGLYCHRRRADNPKKWETEYVPSGQEFNPYEDVMELRDAEHPHIEPEYVKRSTALKIRRKRYYINSGSTPEDYTSGVMECIKYHFKGDTFYDANSKTWDILLMMEVLNNTKNKRLYGRFGSLYKMPELSFNMPESGQLELFGPEDLQDRPALEATIARLMSSYTREQLIAEIRERKPGQDTSGLDRMRKAQLAQILAAYQQGYNGEQPTPQPVWDNHDEETLPDEDVSPPEEQEGKVSNVLENLINPFTATPVEQVSYFALFDPSERKHLSRFHPSEPCTSVESDWSKFTFIRSDVNIKQLIRAIMTNQVKKMLRSDGADYEVKRQYTSLQQLDDLIADSGHLEEYLTTFRQSYFDWDHYDTLTMAEQLVYRIERKKLMLQQKGYEINIDKNTGEISWTHKQGVLL